MPDLIPAHHVVLETGMSPGIGGLAFRLPIIWGSLRKKSSFIEVLLGSGLVKIYVKRVPGLPETLPTGGVYGGVLRIKKLISSFDPSHGLDSSRLASRP